MNQPGSELAAGGYTGSTMNSPTRGGTATGNQPQSPQHMSFFGEDEDDWYNIPPVVRMAIEAIGRKTSSNERRVLALEGGYDRIDGVSSKLQHSVTAAKQLPAELGVTVAEVEGRLSRLEMRDRHVETEEALQSRDAFFEQVRRTNRSLAKEVQGVKDALLTEVRRNDKMELALQELTSVFNKVCSDVERFATDTREFKASFQEKCEKMENRCIAIEQDIKHHDVAHQTLQTRLSNEVRTIERAIATQEDKIRSTVAEESTVARHAEEQLQSFIRDLERRLKEEHAEIVREAEQVKNLGRQVHDVASDVQDVRGQLDSDVSAVKQRQVQLVAEIQDVERRAASMMQESVRVAKNVVHDVEATIKTELHSHETVVGQKLKELELSQVAAAEAIHARVSDDMQTFRRTLTTEVSEQYTTLSSKQSEIVSKNAAVVDECREIRRTVQDHRQQTDTQGTQIQRLRYEILGEADDGEMSKEGGVARCGGRASAAAKPVAQRVSSLEDQLRTYQDAVGEEQEKVTMEVQKLEAEVKATTKSVEEKSQKRTADMEDEVVKVREELRRELEGMRKYVNHAATTLRDQVDDMISRRQQLGPQQGGNGEEGSGGWWPSSVTRQFESDIARVVGLVDGVKAEVQRVCDRTEQLERRKGDVVACRDDMTQLQEDVEEKVQRVLAVVNSTSRQLNHVKQAIGKELDDLRDDFDQRFVAVEADARREPVNVTPIPDSSQIRAVAKETLRPMEAAVDACSSRIDEMDEQFRAALESVRSNVKTLQTSVGTLTASTDTVSSTDLANERVKIMSGVKELVVGREHALQTTWESRLDSIKGNTQEELLRVREDVRSVNSQARKYAQELVEVQLSDVKNAVERSRKELGGVVEREISSIQSSMHDLRDTCKQQRDEVDIVVSDVQREVAVATKTAANAERTTAEALDRVDREVQSVQRALRSSGDKPEVIVEREFVLPPEVQSRLDVLSSAVDNVRAAVDSQKANLDESTTMMEEENERTLRDIKEENERVWRDMENKLSDARDEYHALVQDATKDIESWVHTVNSKIAVFVTDFAELKGEMAMKINSAEVMVRFEAADRTYFHRDEAMELLNTKVDDELMLQRLATKAGAVDVQRWLEDFSSQLKRVLELKMDVAAYEKIMAEMATKVGQEELNIVMGHRRGQVAAT